MVVSASVLILNDSKVVLLVYSRVSVPKAKEHRIRPVASTPVEWGWLKRLMRFALTEREDRGLGMRGYKLVGSGAKGWEKKRLSVHSGGKTRHGNGGLAKKTLSWSFELFPWDRKATILYREINLGIWHCGQVWACRRSLFPTVAAPVCYRLFSFHGLTWTGRLSHVRPFVYV